MLMPTRNSGIFELNSVGKHRARTAGETGTNEDGTDIILQDKKLVLKSFLTQGFGPSRINLVAIEPKEFMDIGFVVQLATLVHMYIFVGTVWKMCL